MRKTKGQTWSIDLIVGVIIFMLIIAIFYAFLSSKSEPALEDLQEDSRATSTKIGSTDASSLGLIVNGQINQTKYNELCDKEYDDLRVEFGLTNDFCFFLEDENNNIIPCGTTTRKAGIGNGEDIEIAEGIYCGAEI